MAELEGRRILIAEDDPLLRHEVEGTLSAHGACVVPVATITDALAVSETPLDHAVLDIHLADGDVHPVAVRLTARGVPVTFLTGERRCEGLTRTYGAARVLEKPALPSLLLAAVTGRRP